MQNENMHEQAVQTFKTLCDHLDAYEWKYSKDEDALRIDCGARGEDLPMDITIEVDEDRQIVLLLSHQPFVVPENKRIDMAVAVSVINNLLIDGCFDFNIKDGHMFYRSVNSFRDSALGEKLFHYMIACSCRTIDEYNDKLMLLSTGLISLEQFIELVNG